MKNLFKQPTDRLPNSENNAFSEFDSEFDTIKRQFFESSQFLKILLDTIPSPIFYKDTNGVYQNCNDAFADMILGIHKEKIINKSLLDLPDEIPRELAEIYMQADQKLFDNPGKQEYKAIVSCADGKQRTFMFYKSTVENEAGVVIGLVGIMLDISQLEEKHQHLELLSLTDALTGLFNRRKFDSVFPQILLPSQNKQTLLNFAIIDIDNFKAYNDQYGHDQGDLVLKATAKIIQTHLKRSSDYAFRLGGEEFGILFYSNNETDALRLAHQIREDIEQLYGKTHNPGLATVITISMGLLSLVSHNNEPEYIYRKADKLLYQAKSAGKNTIFRKIL